MIRRAVIAAGLAAAATSARAQPAIDVADLPPLPPATDAPSSSAALLAAADVNEDVVVGAAKREQSLGTVASAVTVISADRLRRFGYRTVGEAISAVAGVFVQDTRLTQQVGVRGLAIAGGFNSRILILVDGATVNEAWGAFAGVGWDAVVAIDDIARIEVIRGPVSSIYGTNAFFGIINIVTRGAADGASAWGRIGVGSIAGEIASAGFVTGSVDEQLRGSVLAMNRIGESLTVPAIAGDTLLDEDGGHTLLVSLVGQRGGSFAQLRAYRSRRDSPFAPYDSDPGLAPGYSQLNHQLLLEGGHTRELAPWLTLGGRAYGMLYRYQDEIRTLDDDPFLDYGDAMTGGVEVRGRAELVAGGRLGLTAGAEANANRTESRAFFRGREADGAKVPVDFTTQGLYAELDGRATSWLAITAGARFDRHSVVHDGTRLTPRAAALLSWRDWLGFKLLYAEGFRNPSMFEGFFADNVDFIANAAITSETIRSVEAVGWMRWGGLLARVSGFSWAARDVIEQRLVDTVLQFQNVGTYESRGVEVEASYRDRRGWYGFAGLCASAVDGGAIGAPELTWTAGASTPRLAGRVHLSVEAQGLSARTTRDPAVDAPAWTGINAVVYVPDLHRFDLTVGVRNLLGTRDLTPAPDDYDRFPDDMDRVLVARVPGEGREVYARVGYTY